MPAVAHIVVELAVDANEVLITGDPRARMMLRVDREHTAGPDDDVVDIGAALERHGVQDVPSARLETVEAVTDTTLTSRANLPGRRLRPDAKDLRRDALETSRRELRSSRTDGTPGDIGGKRAGLTALRCFVKFVR